MAPRGALQAAREAREQGLVRFIGVTGHGLGVAQAHLRSLQEFDFDTVLLPYNYWTLRHPAYAAQFEELVELCRQRHVAVQTIKAIARKHWTGQSAHHHTTWYEPLVEQADIDTAVHWVLSRPGFFLNAAGNIPLLPRLLDAAGRISSAAPVAELERRLAAIEGSSLF
jgi:aryl-alcohol dehydrogenase-like predicted oxidoreductase